MAKASKAATLSRYQLHISLQCSEPEIWRRVMVRADTTFYKLHWVIQCVMGW